jgi:hypothetical protein
MIIIRTLELIPIIVLIMKENSERNLHSKIRDKEIKVLRVKREGEGRYRRERKRMMKYLNIGVPL